MAMIKKPITKPFRDPFAATRARDQEAIAMMAQGYSFSEAWRILLTREQNTSTIAPAKIVNSSGTAARTP